MFSDTYPRPYAVNSASGHPVAFTHGVFAGRTIRVEIEEIQKADLGRKYARKDKRPLDPPPVVLCRFFEYIDRGDGTSSQVELDPEEACSGAVCHAELFPVPVNVHEPKLDPPSSSSQRPSMLPSDRGEVSHTVPVLHDSRQYPHVLPSMNSPPPLCAPVTACQLPLGMTSTSTHCVDLSAPRFPHIVAWFGSYPIYEDSKCPALLAGATFVPGSIVEIGKERMLMFVFSDLSVKIEGTFVLRYRVFSLLSGFSHTVYKFSLAECYGGAFKVFSTKDFPGLRASSTLTKHLALHGVRVNRRESSRKRHKKYESGPDDEGDAHVEHAEAQEGPSLQSPATSSSPTTSYGSWEFTPASTMHPSDGSLRFRDSLDPAKELVEWPPSGGSEC
ncbi:velvet factor-domain-containing protein [Trametes punicea]|nr:velvet factor-domain-containing protein [Trametes punicea]